jgi:hypothetical protein
MKIKLIKRSLLLFVSLAALSAAPAATANAPNYCDPLGGCRTHHKTHHRVKRCHFTHVRRHHHLVRVRVCKTVTVFS